MADLCKNCSGSHLPLACRLALTQCLACQEMGHLGDFCPTGPRSRDKTFSYRMLCANCDKWHLPSPCEYALQKCPQCGHAGHMNIHCPVAPVLRVPATVNVNLRYETTVTEFAIVGQPAITKSVPVTQDVISLIRFDAAKTMLDLLKAYDPVYVVAMFAKDVPAGVVSNNALLMPRAHVSLADFKKLDVYDPSPARNGFLPSPQANAHPLDPKTEHHTSKSISSNLKAQVSVPKQHGSGQNGTAAPREQQGGPAGLGGGVELVKTPLGLFHQAQVAMAAASGDRPSLVRSHVAPGIVSTRGYGSFGSPVVSPPPTSASTSQPGAQTSHNPKKRKNTVVKDEAQPSKKKRAAPVPRCDDCKRRKKRCVHNVAAMQVASPGPPPDDAESPYATPIASQGYSHDTTNASARMSSGGGVGHASSQMTTKAHPSIETAAGGNNFGSSAGVTGNQSNTPVDAAISTSWTSSTDQM